MRPFRSSPLFSLSRRSLAAASHSGHVVKRRPRPRLLSTTSPRPTQNDQPKNVLVHNVGSRSIGRRLLSAALYAAATVAAFRLLGGKLADADDAATQLESPQRVNLHDVGDDEAIFIALQYPKQLPRKHYKASDPDWVEFRRFSNNKARRDALQKELAERVRRDISNHQHMSHILGKNIQMTRYWLDFEYPHAPPPEYARTGIEISDEFVALSTQVIPHSYYIQLSHILWPKAVFGAGYMSINVFARMQLVKLKNLCGLELSPNDKKIQLLSVVEQTRGEVNSASGNLKTSHEKNEAIAAKVKQRLKDMENPTRAASKPSVDVIPATPPITTTTSDPAPAPSSIWTALKRSRPSPSSDQGSASSQLLNWLPSPPIPTPEHVLKPLTSSTDIAVAWKTFAAVLVKDWQKSATDTMPKGSFFVVGHVEVKGDRARCKAKIRAAYDPKQAKFIFVTTSVENLWHHAQPAKGGR